MLAPILSVALLVGDSLLVLQYAYLREKLAEAGIVISRSDYDAALEIEQVCDHSSSYTRLCTHTSGILITLALS
jgi:hypothetical protein